VINKTTADWRDVQQLKEMLLNGKQIKELRFQAAALSHVKFVQSGGNLKMHLLRKKYRTWFIRNAIKEAKKELKRGTNNGFKENGRNP
jgi:hypothetical protein